jgi:pimeloyl-ACP methyl ester carboxylesterase
MDRAATGNQRETEPTFPGAPTDYHGFARHDFTVDGCPAIVVQPTDPLPGRPWVWRAEFFDAFPLFDLAMLERGCYLAYIQVGNTFGCPSALAHWDVFYEELTGRYGFSPKPILEGLSRGGLYIYNWAAAHPHNVSCLYGDAPVCDFKSWPAGRGQSPGSPTDWQKLIQDYGFQSEAEALAYPGNPIDNLQPLAEANIPIIHVYGDADPSVPWKENTRIVADRYRALGGTVELIPKPGVEHHPHGLDDPTPVVEFALECQ